MLEELPPLWERIMLPFVIGGAVILAGVWVGALAPNRNGRRSGARPGTR